MMMALVVVAVVMSTLGFLLKLLVALIIVVLVVALPVVIAVVRALVPFAVVLAESTLSNTDERERTMITAAKHLNDCYKHLPADEFHGLGLKENAIRFAGAYIALSQTSTHEMLWRVKPKMHLFLELCDGSVEPSNIRAYRDEELGGAGLQCLAGAAAG